MGTSKTTIISENDLKAIHKDISTNCAIYTDQVKFGVEITLDAVLKLIRKRSEQFTVTALTSVSKT